MDLNNLKIIFLKTLTKKMMIEIKKAVDERSTQSFNTSQLRENFLVTGIFKTGAVNLTYSYYDRLIVGGVSPDKEIQLLVDKQLIGAEYLLERREMGIINVGGKGKVLVDGTAFDLDFQDCLYIGQGAKDIRFSSNDINNRSRFYVNCAPAHKSYPISKITRAETKPVHLGSSDKSNTRSIYKYIHPEGVKSCQLVMGVTLLEPNNIWNTMPAHTHDRRMEAYFYFNLPDDEVVFHLMGEPSETRHIVVRNEEIVLSPSWSIHSGVGTNNYSFIWGMAGENQTFTDMDSIEMSAIF